jgi:hypothetical protein
MPASTRLPFNGIKAEETVIGPKAGSQVIGNRNRPEACVSSHSSSDLLPGERTWVLVAR